MRARVQINYKSGISMIAECESFAVKVKPGGARSYEWEDMVPRPLLLNADEVESVWELLTPDDEVPF